MLKERREALGLTQRELARKAGLSFRTIQVWERGGTGSAQVGNLQKLARAMGCSLDDLCPMDECRL